MVTRSDAPDLAVDELKRRARRRLVGAIVLALAAAVLLPLLLESEPKPLGDEVSIQIPPIDNGKFVNPLSPGKGSPSKGGRDTAPKNSVPAGSGAPGASLPSGTGAEGKNIEATEPSATRTAPTEGEQKSSEAKSAAPTTSTSTSAPAMTSPAATPSAVEPKKETPTEPKASNKQSDAAPAGAFTDRYGAQVQARKLKQAGFPAYVEAVANDKGELQRVRVGPYASRDAADAARAKLKGAGYDAIVARAR